MLKRLCVLMGALGIVTAVAVASDETISRVFRLEHVSVSEISAAVQALLSESGSLTLQPKLSKIVVQDEPEVVDRVTELIERLDHVPGRFSVRFDLLKGGSPTPYGSVQEVEVEKRVLDMFKVEAFQRLGKSTVEGEVGSPSQADLGKSFQVSFVARMPEYSESTPWGAPDPGDRLNLHQLVLERMTVGSDGRLVGRELLRTNVLLSPRQTVYIGAGNSEESEEVLVLIVHAETFGSD